MKESKIMTLKLLGISKKLLISTIFTLALVVPLFVGYAQNQAEGCDGWQECVFYYISEAIPDINIMRTTFDFMGTLMTDIPLYFLYGKSSAQLHACYVLIMNQDLGKSCPYTGEDNTLIDDGFNIADCNSLRANPMTAAAGITEPVPITGNFAGSFMGLGMAGANVVYSDPMPVSLAYYARDVASHTLFLKSTAFAQTNIDTSNFFGFDIILNLWKATRNIAFAMMAVFMLIIGMMVMMRKQLDPRTVVTVQNSLPRIVVSLALIAFSYAFGALAVALILPLTSVSFEPLRWMASEASGLGLPLTFLAMVWSSNVGQVATMVTVFFMVIALAVLAVLLALLILKAMVAYTKLLVAIVVAPLQFAWGSIPGNEESITKWFKSVAAYVLTVPAITAGISVGIYFAWSAVTSNACTAPAYRSLGTILNPFAGMGSTGLVNMIMPIVVMAIFLQTSKLPKKIEEALLGEDKRRR